MAFKWTIKVAVAIVEVKSNKSDNSLLKILKEKKYLIFPLIFSKFRKNRKFLFLKQNNTIKCFFDITKRILILLYNSNLFYLITY